MSNSNYEETFVESEPYELDQQEINQQPFILPGNARQQQNQDYRKPSPQQRQPEQPRKGANSNMSMLARGGANVMQPPKYDKDVPYDLMITNNDTDLQALKKKLTIMKQMSQPENKEDLISFLLQRLQLAEECIHQSENLITSERNYRKQVSQDLKIKNQELRKQIEIEKKNLVQKIDEQMEHTLQMAVRDRIETQQKLSQAEHELRERQKEILILTDTNSKQTETISQLRRDQEEKQRTIDKVQTVLGATVIENEKLKAENIERHEAANKAIKQCDDAVQALMKIDETRIMMNKVMGPGGPMTVQERSYLPLQGQGNYSIEPGPRRNNQQPANKLGAPFVEKPKAILPAQGGLVKQKPNASPEEEFWYQTPKGGGDYGR